MPKIINGALRVEEYIPTGNVGEYSFENAIFNNQADSGNGAYDIVVGYVIFVAASDSNTFNIIPGTSNRYILTSVQIIDSATISGTMLWDGVGAEWSLPTNGVTSIISQTTTHLKFGLPAIDTLYADITPGSTIAAMMGDSSKIIDRLIGDYIHPMLGVVSKVFSFTSQTLWRVKHDLNTINFSEAITNNSGQRIYAAVTIIDNNEFLIEFTEPEAGSVSVMFFVNN